MNYSSPIVLLFAIFLCFSCSEIRKVTDIVVQPTAREVYAREFKEGDLQYAEWTSQFSTSKNNQLSLSLPFTLSGTFLSGNSQPLAYSMSLENGDSLLIDVLQTVDSSLVFIDLFAFQNDSVVSEKPIVSAELDANTLQFSIKFTGKYKVIIQPELYADTNFNLLIYTKPTLKFPVAGKDNMSIQSFWGATRDRGNRTHEGVDIFANRGTPVVAGSDGFVSSARERGLGGKQVWLRNGVFGYSMYYAHLDSINVVSGVHIKRGDTLGFVGNSGNAKTTNPHLHFGIYTNAGAVNPLPFIKMREMPSIEDPKYVANGVTKRRDNQLRTGPNMSFEKLAIISSSDTLKLLGKSEQWYHVTVADTLEGFMHESLISIQ